MKLQSPPCEVCALALNLAKIEAALATRDRVAFPECRAQRF
jgi:hypothetical protein